MSFVNNLNMSSSKVLSLATVTMKISTDLKPEPASKNWIGWIILKIFLIKTISFNYDFYLFALTNNSYLPFFKSFTIKFDFICKILKREIPKIISIEYTFKLYTLMILVISQAMHIISWLKRKFSCISICIKAPKDNKLNQSCLISLEDMNWLNIREWAFMSCGQSQRFIYYPFYGFSKIKFSCKERRAKYSI